MIINNDNTNKYDIIGGINMKYAQTTTKKDWDSGYKNYIFRPAPKTYPICRLIFKHIKTTADKNVFEMGCFPGRFLFHFGHLGYELNGIDQTEFLKDMIGWLKDNNLKLGSFVQGNVFKAKLDKKYDVVFSAGFIEHFTNFKEVIKIQAEMVKDNGHIFITTPNFAGTIQKKLHNTFDIENLKRHYLPSMNNLEWENVLKEKGFKIIDSGYIGGFDFWVGDQNRSLWQKMIIKMMRMILPIRFIPNSRHYSPEIYLIAQKI